MNRARLTLVCLAAIAMAFCFGCSGTNSPDKVFHVNFVVESNRLEELRGALEDAVEKGRQLRAARTGLTVIPEQNDELFIVPER